MEPHVSHHSYNLFNFITTSMFSFAIHRTGTSEHYIDVFYFLDSQIISGCSQYTTEVTFCNLYESGQRTTTTKVWINYKLSCSELLAITLTLTINRRAIGLQNFCDDDVSFLLMAHYLAETIIC